MTRLKMNNSEGSTHVCREYGPRSDPNSQFVRVSLKDHVHIGPVLDSKTISVAPQGVRQAPPKTRNGLLFGPAFSVAAFEAWVPGNGSFFHGLGSPCGSHKHESLKKKRKSNETPNVPTKMNQNALCLKHGYFRLRFLPKESFTLQKCMYFSKWALLIHYRDPGHF